MLKIFKNSRRQLIAITSVSLVLFLALSAKFWSDAYVIRMDVSEAQRISARENHLFELASSLADEREQMYKISNAGEGVPLRLSRFDEASRRTDELIKTNLRYVWDAAGSRVFHSNHSSQDDRSSHPFSTASMDDELSAAGHSGHAMSAESANQFHLVEIDELFHNLSRARKDIKLQFSKDASQRNPQVGMQYFHLYMNLIDSIGSIRDDLKAVSPFSDESAGIHQNLRQSIWELSESTAQISALIEGVRLHNDQSTTGHYMTMLGDANYKALRAWKSIDNISRRNHLHDSLGELAHSTTEWYRNNYKKHNEFLTKSIQQNRIDSVEIDAWLQATQTLRYKVEALRLEATSSMLGTLKRLERKATVNLLFDSLLFLLCLMMALASVWYFRKVHRQAHQDELTGLDNRRMFAQRISESIQRAQSENTQCALLIIDLDRFKYVNDTMGHNIGDRLLKEVSKRLLHVCGTDVVLARLGGDEFAVLFERADSEFIQKIACDISSQLARPFELDSGTVQVASSIGVSYCPQDATEVDQLMKAADLAMYGAKKSGSNGFLEYHSEMVAAFEYRARTESELRLAIARNEFVLFYQPQYSVKDETVESVEALIRWQHPERGLVFPDQFIPIAEEFGLMPLLGDWVLKEACRQAQEWISTFGVHLRIAVNVSAEQFLQPTFVASVIEHLQAHSLEPKYIELELTESVVMHDIAYVVEALTAIRQYGIHIALDDFGTGYSSLRYLKDLPLDTLKIDRSFVQKFGTGDERHDSITLAIAELADILDLETVAEGVETEDQNTQLEDIGISHIQGYFYSKPVEPEAALRAINIINSNGVNSSGVQRKAA